MKLESNTRENEIMIAAKILEEQTTIEWVPVNEIGIDMSYQRPLSQDKVKVIIAKFNEVAAGVLIVSLRDDGQVVVIDGQHRLEAMKKRGIARAECKVCQGLTVEQEAEIYIYCNTARKQPDSLDVFRARLVRQDPIAMAINDIVEKCGLHIQFHLYRSRGGRRLPNGIWAIQALEDIYKRGKEKVLEEVLTLAIRSWPGEGNALEAKVLLGIAAFHFKYQGKYSREEFIAKMNITDLKVLYRRAQFWAEAGGHASTAFAKALQEAYDRGRRTRRLEKGQQ